MERRYGPLTIVGIKLRTTNQDGQSFQDIPPFWQKFFEEGVANTIPHKASEDVFAVYTNFAHESVDNEGVFSLVIGCPVHEVKHLPGELTAIEIPSSKYKILTRSWVNLKKLSKSGNRSGSSLKKILYLIKGAAIWQILSGISLRVRLTSILG
jgi:predicted transcriptional regulator YdeE